MPVLGTTTHLQNPRRNITVFSGGLDALTIKHGSEKEPSAGPDLLVSYHDNDHYNSVRNNKDKNLPPPPIKTYQKTDEILVDDLTPSTTQDDAQSMDIDSGEANDATKGEAKPVKKGQCPCGSGKKYRKCCAAREKKASKLKPKQEKEDDSDESSEPGMDGEFRVLHI